VSRLIDTLAADAPAALAAIDAARAAARSSAWSLAGVHAPDHDIDASRPLVIDVDATLVTSHSEKEQAAPTFKRGFGFHPVRREALTIRAEVKDHRRRPCRSRAVKLRAARSGRSREGREPP
jgi:hypothetical protein